LAKASTPVLIEDVLRVAVELFRVRGYHKTRMQDIAAKFDVTHAALYYHFKSKQDILAQINLAAIADILGTALAIEQQELPVEERFQALVRAHFLWVAKNTAQASALFNLDDELPPGALRRVRNLRREYTKLFRDLYVAGVAEGKFPDVDPQIAIGFILGGGNWIYTWYQPGDSRKPEMIADIGVQLVAKGFLGRSLLGTDPPQR
jgi:AcrR family transcriptional regulator